MSSWLLRSHKIYIPNWLQLPNSFAHTHCEAQVAASSSSSSSGFSYEQAACTNIYNNAAPHSLTHAKLVLVFSRAVDLLHIEWFRNLPLERINDTVNHMRFDAKTHSHTDSRHTGRRSSHAWRHNWNSHSAFVGQSERARARHQTICLITVKNFKMFEILFAWRRRAQERGTDWHVNCEFRIREWHSSTQSDAQIFFCLRTFAAPPPIYEKMIEFWCGKKSQRISISQFRSRMDRFP